MEKDKILESFFKLENEEWKPVAFEEICAGDVLVKLSLPGVYFLASTAPEDTVEYGRAFQATSITTVPVAFNWEDQKSC